MAWSRATRTVLGRVIAAAFLDGPWEREALAARGRAALIPSPRWMPVLADHVTAVHRAPPRDAPRALAVLIATWLAGRDGPVPQVLHRHLPEGAMALRRPWPVPALDGVDDLAALLGLDGDALAWLADVRGLERTAPPGARNWRYAWIARPGRPVRLLEQPRPRLKAAQRTVLREILDRIPAHDAAHGFVAGRSVRSHAAAHVGAEVVLRFDLEDFFATIAAGRVFGVLRTAGYPESVAHVLTGLCTNVVAAGAWAQVPRPDERDGPRAVHAHARLGRRLATPHLPQGAPTSPMLANLCAFRLDRRLAGLARSLGAAYTRYADDLVLSGPRRLASRATRIEEAVARIAADEGFVLHPGKTQVMPRAGRQRVTGIVVNERPNVAREEYDRLKAALHRARHDGPAAATPPGVADPGGGRDPRAHLLGRIAWVASLNPARGRALERRLARIRWDG